MQYTRNYNFTAGETIVADQVDDELNSLRTIINGNIEADNIKDATITTDKLEASLDPTTRTSETIGDMVVSGIELQAIRGLTGTWSSRDESFDSGYAYISGDRISCAGGSKTFDASTTTYVVLDTSGNLQYVSSLTGLGYTNLPLYKVITDATKITEASPMGWTLIGTVLPFVGKSAPNNYILCDGSEVSRTTYRKLFNVIQNNFGTPSGSTAFKVPDMRTRTIHGFGDPTYYTVFGGTGGGYSTAHTHTGVDHLHYASVSGTTDNGGTYNSGRYSSIANYSTSWSPPGHTHTVTSGGWTGGSDRSLTSGSTAPSILDPYIVMSYIIRAS